MPGVRESELGRSENRLYLPEGREGDRRHSPWEQVQAGHGVLDPHGDTSKAQYGVFEGNTASLPRGHGVRSRASDQFNLHPVWIQKDQGLLVKAPLAPKAGNATLP